MASILYYSKHCGNCNKLLKTLTSDIKNSMHFPKHRQTNSKRWKNIHIIGKWFNDSIA